MACISFNKAIVLFFLLLIGQKGQSQSVFREGYYLNEAKDTIRGLLKIKGKLNAPDVFIFKESNTSQEKELRAETVHAVVINGYRYFKSIQINDNPSFAQTLVEGKLNLYLRDKDFYLEKNHQLNFLTIEEIKIGTAVHRKMSYLGILKAAMVDCPSLSKTIDKTRLDENSLTSLVENYNQRLNSPVVVFKKSIPLFKIRINPLVALSYAKVRIDVATSFTGPLGYMEEADLSEIALSPGIGINLYSPRLDDRFSFYTELRYVKNTLNDRVYSTKTTFDDNDMTINYRYIFLPIMAKYDIPLKIKSSLFVQGGLIKTFKLNAEYVNVRRFTIFPNDPPTVEKDRYQFYSGQLGFTAGIGYQRSVSKKINLSSELRMENVGPIINSTSVGFLQNVYSIVTAVSF